METVKHVAQVLLWLVIALSGVVLLVSSLIHPAWTGFRYSVRIQDIVPTGSVDGFVLGLAMTVVGVFKLRESFKRKR